MPRESGASSIPETAVLERISHGVLDRPVEPGDDTDVLAGCRLLVATAQKNQRASCTLRRKRWISRSVRDDQPSPLPRTRSRIRALTGSTSALAFSRSIIT